MTITRVGKDVEDKDHLHILGGDANEHSYCGKQYGGAQIFRNRIWSTLKYTIFSLESSCS